MNVTPHSSFVDWLIDTRMIAPIRLVLAAAALLIIYIDPSQPDRFVRLVKRCFSLVIAAGVDRCDFGVRAVRLYGFSTLQ